MSTSRYARHNNILKLEAHRDVCNGSALAPVKVNTDWGQRPVIDPRQVQNMRQQRRAWVLYFCQHYISPKILQSSDLAQALSSKRRRT